MTAPIDPAQVDDLDVAILCAHGIGSQGPGYADALAVALVDRLARAGIRARVFEVCWGAGLARQQADYLAQTGLDGALHRVAVEMLGDALAWGGGGREVMDAAVASALRRCATADRVVAVGHSLGGLILWGGIREAQRLGATRPAAADRIAGLALLGSPLVCALMDGTSPLGERQPLPPAWGVSWSGPRVVELRDADDPLALPVGVDGWWWARDVASYPVRVEGIAGLTPLAHLGYWRCAEVVDVLGRWIAAGVGR